LIWLTDDFWYLNPSQTVDKYGRWVVDSSKFPHGIAALAHCVRGFGLQFGL
jgi:alpha-galactosidase